MDFLEEERPSINQLRYAALVELNPLTPDPDIDVLWERKLIPIEELNAHLEWGPIGDHLQQRAKEWFESL